MIDYEALYDYENEYKNRIEQIILDIQIKYPHIPNLENILLPILFG
jgi:hypothetical protein